MDSLTIFPPSVRNFVIFPSSRRHSAHIPRKSSWSNTIVTRTNNIPSTSAEETFDNVGLHSSRSEAGDDWNTLENITALGLSFQTESHQGSPKKLERFSIDDVDESEEHSYHRLDDRPFNKWMRSLQKRGPGRRRTLSGTIEANAIEQEFFHSPGTRRASHKKTSSQSSSGFVTAVRSASISLASLSIAPRSRRTDVSSRHQRKSSKTSNIARLSEDTSYNAKHMVLDQAVTNRALKRRQVLEELISTEESYLGDMKFLMHVYVTLLASLPSLSLSLKSSINNNLNDIVSLHEEILGDLHRIVPHSEYTQLSATPLARSAGVNLKSHGHQRWRSLDAITKNSDSAGWLRNTPGMTADPSVAADVAKAFGKRESCHLDMNKFFLHEEYGSKYELMIRDVASAYRTMPQWEVYQKGLEALASSLSSLNHQNTHGSSRKALTVGDLLVKPIQRVCRYPLLFAELLKQTPVYDCPESHMEIENALLRLREATMEINRATDDPRMKLVMERTWLLQDRLVFEEMLETGSVAAVRSLGHNHLCGVLHVSWQIKYGVDGQYLICLLYRHFLILASINKTDNFEHFYRVQACIALSALRVEDVDNGRGLQCHTAPYSWKIIFECDHQLYETIMTACSPREELEWRSRLAGRCEKEDNEVNDQALLSSLNLAIKPLGTVFGKPGTIARRLSIHRATTVGPTSLCQVIIKNTYACKETSSYSSINRSQSLLTTNRIPVLAPSRSGRIQLENALADVWTRDILPFPGMTSRIRSDHIVRNSAHSMMRKLSVASIASNFSKRSVSNTSTHNLADNDPRTGSAEFKSKGKVSHQESSDTLCRPHTPIEPKIVVFQFEKENNFRAGSTESLFTIEALAGGTPRKASPLNAKKSWIRDGDRLITPPLRTSSANSVKPTRMTSLSTVADSQTAEQSSLSPLLPAVSPTISDQSGKKSRARALVLKKSVVTEGIKNFFR